MVDFDTPGAVQLLGKTVLLELAWDDEPRSQWRCVVIVGVVLAMEGVYANPHFLTMDLGAEQAFPSEMFWEDIRSVRVLKPGLRRPDVHEKRRDLLIPPNF